ncbi:MAG: Protein-glutamate O-methyltransferase [Chloroflexota bacterium]|nr:Protein-glutamate O-methyltransferase [Chloroflexota bacterium]
MRFYTETLGLSQNAFVLLRDLIHDRLGLFYEDGKQDLLSDKLSSLVVERGFDSFLDYYYLLKYDEDAADEWRRVINALSVQETYFWREVDQVRAVADVVAQQYFAGRPAAPLRIWSAACATGEEPLTIAMALNEAGWLGRVPIEIYATDASPAAIAKAQAGIYRERSFRALSTELRDRYFTAVRPSNASTFESAQWQVAPWLRAAIRWDVVNLVSESDMQRAPAAHVIFCRNVFIYFSDNSIRKTVRFFGQRLSAPGCLFVGASESLLRIAADFDLQDIGGAFVYLKR